jgi:hypothetical protein
MRTPAGTECPFFYGNYYRGRSDEECRLIGNQPPPRNWTRDLCAVCPVPKIKRANSCEFMTLSGTVQRGILGIGKKVIVSAYCRKSNSDVKVPEIGCGICHPLNAPVSYKKG